MTRPTLSKPIGVRLKADIKEKFFRKSFTHGGPSEVLRILVLAYVEDRLTIKPKKELP